MSNKSEDNADVELFVESIYFERICVNLMYETCVISANMEDIKDAKYLYTRPTDLATVKLPDASITWKDASNLKVLHHESDYPVLRNICLPNLGNLVTNHDAQSANFAEIMPNLRGLFLYDFDLDWGTFEWRQGETILPSHLRSFGLSYLMFDDYSFLLPLSALENLSVSFTRHSGYTSNFLAILSKLTNLRGFGKLCDRMLRKCHGGSDEARERLAIAKKLIENWTRLRRLSVFIDELPVSEITFADSLEFLLLVGARLDAIDVGKLLTRVDVLVVYSKDRLRFWSENRDFEIRYDYVDEKRDNSLKHRHIFKFKRNSASAVYDRYYNHECLLICEDL